MPKLSVVVAVNSEIAFEELDGESLLSLSLAAAHNFGIETSLPNQLFVAAQNLTEVRKATSGLNFNPKMISMLESLGARKTKIHHTYRKEIS